MEPAYNKIFKRIRSLTQQEQEKLLVGFYTEGVKDFPNGKTLGKFLARVNNIDWFKPKETPDQSLLEKLVQQHLSCLNLPSLPVRLIRGLKNQKKDWGKAGVAWDAAQNAARTAAQNAAQNAARGAEWEAAQEAAREAARGAVWGTVWATWNAFWDDAVRGAAWGAISGAVRGAEWIVVKDLMPQKGYDKGNPLEPLVEIYGLGCWPIGLVPNKNGKKEFVVFIPSIQKTA